MPFTPASRVSTFGTTIFAEMTHLADEHRAINLSQGFPDFDGPGVVKEAALAAIRAGDNQYAISSGQPRCAARLPGTPSVSTARPLTPISRSAKSKRHWSTQRRGGAS